MYIHYPVFLFDREYTAEIQVTIVEYPQADSGGYNQPPEGYAPGSDGEFDFVVCKLMHGKDALELPGWLKTAIADDLMDDEEFQYFVWKAAKK